MNQIVFADQKDCAKTQQDLLGVTAVFFHRILGVSELVFRCKDKYVQSQLTSDMPFSEFSKTLRFCSPQEISAELISWEPFCIYLPNQRFHSPYWEGHFITIYEEALKNAHFSVKTFCFMSHAERELVINTWNDTKWDFPDHQTLHELIEEKCAACFQQEAIRFAGKAITYEEFNTRANQLACHLRFQGVGRESLVAICMNRSIELVVSLLAILKAGGAYVPMDPSYPEERLLYILSDSRAKILLTQRSFASRFSLASTQMIFVDRSDDFSEESKNNLKNLNTSDDFCYCIYTSGSTGKPKGVGNIHKGVVNRLLWMHKEYRLDPSDRVLQKTPFGFDVSVWEFFWPLMVGATLVIAEPEIHKDAEALADLIHREKIGVLHFVPSMLDLFLEADVSSTCHSLKKVFTSGEALSKNVEKKFFQIFHAELHNLYGPTEASIDVTYWPCQPSDSHTTVPIGYPIANTQIYILDELLQPVPMGTSGELFIGGVGLARGYIYKPELTREKFIPHPFNPKERVYRTGDLCRFLPDGAIEYLGRIDHQIKLRGFRIELGEIETVLRAHPSVKSAAVTAREDIPGQKYLAAYVIASSPSIEEELIAQLQTSLPEYMIPSAFVFLPAFPLSPNGKLDVKNLPKPKRMGRFTHTPFVAARNDLESKLLVIWKEVLEIDEIGVQNGFFSLGGHSLKAMQLVVRIKRTLNKWISLPEIFSHPTIEEQARILQNRDRKFIGEETTIHDLANRYEPFALTDIQKAYLIGRTEAFSFGGIKSHVYAENIRGNIEHSRLEQALNQLIERHDMLRAVVLEDGTQRILDRTPRYEICVSSLTKEETRQQMKNNMEKATDSWPLFDIRISKDRIHFLFDLLIADGTGLEVIFQELSLLYQNLDLELPPLNISYRDCLIAMQTQNLEEAKQYWFNRMDSLPDAPELPLRFSADAGPFLRYKGSLLPDEWKKVQERAAKSNVSSAAYLVTLYGEAIKVYSKSSHFTLNVMFFNRPPLHPDIDRVVGNFSATLLLEMDLRGPDNKVGMVQQQLLNDLEHASFNGIKVLNEKNRRQGGSTAAAMPIVFACALNLRPESHRTGPLQEFEWYGKTVPYNYLETPQVLLDHQVFEEKDGTLCFHWDIREGYFADGVIESMFQIYMASLKGEEITLPISSKKCLHEAFFEQAAKEPDRIAVISRRKTLTYQALEKAALYLSERLESLILSPDDHIAIIMNKGWEQIPAVLGIHTAGCAYLPIDAALPQARIQTILLLSKARAAICQSPLSFPIDIPCFFIEEKEPMKPFRCKQKPSDLAYTIFTSGSTGAPKGVMIEHRAALNTVEAISKKYKVNKNDCWYASASLSFDLSVYDVFGPLSLGGSLYIPEKDEAPSSWLATIEQHRITIWNSTPALVQILADQADLYPPLGSHCRLFMMSGDWIPVSLPDRIRKHFKAEIYSLGGATEASIWSNDYLIASIDPAWPSIPYGKALPNQTMIILDEELEQRPVWATGMIYIGGRGLARGYLNDPEKTAQSFIFHPKTKERLYRTGDLGRLHEDGNIEFLGREDLQVKVQGYRIELEEIEAGIQRYEGVKQAVVRIVGKKSEAKKIVAFFTAFKPIELQLLESNLSQILPSYMMPHHLMQIETIPLNGNGKVDLAALILKITDSAHAIKAYAEPVGETEKKLAEILSLLLNMPKVGRNDNFFGIGGTSFLAFRFLFLAQKELGLSIPIAALFQKGTIKELADLRKSEDDPSFISLKTKGKGFPLFLIHPSGGGALCYTELASLLSDRPVYAFQAPGFLDGRNALPTIEAMAELYLKILLEKQPLGPYYIGGWSLGGVVAYQMARRFREMGKEHAPLILIDSPTPYSSSSPDQSTLYRWFREDYGDALLTFDESSQQALFELFKTHLHALGTYHPKKSAIELILLKAEQVDAVEHLKLHPYKERDDWGWGTITSGSIKQYAFAATHSSILQFPCVKEIAAILDSI